MLHIVRKKPLIVTLAVIAFLVVSAVNMSSANAHEWTLKVNGKVQKIEAKVVDFDGENVQLEAENGVKKSFPINELTDEDLEYVKNIVITRQTAVSEKLNLKQLQQERLRNQLQYRDIWQVQLYLPNGQYRFQTFLARNNRDAQYQAHQKFPNARVGGVRKLNREGSFQL